MSNIIEHGSKVELKKDDRKNVKRKWMKKKNLC